MNTKTQVMVDGYTVDLPCVDRLIYPDGRKHGVRLNKSDWDRADYRLPCDALQAVYRNHPGIACKVFVTGRKVVRKFGLLCVRVRIILIGDGEPDTEFGGYMPITHYATV